MHRDFDDHVEIVRQILAGGNIVQGHGQLQQKA
jgi:hypothetical protein